MPDQRGHHHRIDVEIAQQFVEEGLVRRLAERGAADRIGQHEAAQRRRGKRTVDELERFAVATARGIAARDQDKIVARGVCRGEIAHETLGAATPAVQHVQHDRLAVKPDIGAWSVLRRG